MSGEALEFDDQFQEPLCKFAHRAMACDWGLWIAGESPEYAQQVAAAAWQEVDRLERELSRYVAQSDVSQVNASQPGEWVRVGDAALECLKLASVLHEQTGGAFDVTIGSVVNLSPRHAGEFGPQPVATDFRNPVVGMSHLQIDAARHTVRRMVEGVMIDLGAIGKGHAVDQVADLAREWKVAAALIHSGQSTALGLGAPPDRDGWPVAIRDPRDHAATIGVATLRDAALSGSGIALHGQHIIDPRTATPAAGPLGAWALAPGAALSDAVSTAFMVMAESDVARYCDQHPEIAAMLLHANSQMPKRYESPMMAGRFQLWRT